MATPRRFLHICLRQRQDTGQFPNEFNLMEASGRSVWHHPNLGNYPSQNLRGLQPQPRLVSVAERFAIFSR